MLQAVYLLCCKLSIYFRTGVYLFRTGARGAGVYFYFSAQGFIYFARGRGARAFIFIFPHRGLFIRTGARGAGVYFYFSAQGFIYSHGGFSLLAGHEAQGFILFTRGAGVYFNFSYYFSAQGFIYLRGVLFLFLFFRAGFDVLTQGRGVLF